MVLKIIAYDHVYYIHFYHVILLPNQTAAEISAQVDLETKTVNELIDLDIWHHEVYFIKSFSYIVYCT